MRIAILGTRGIPNHYGGYDQYAEFLALGLTKRGHEVIVYNSYNHPYQKSTWNNISIVHIYDSEFKYGSLGRFVYNLRCVRDLKNRNCDAVFQLDYTTLSLWNFLIPKDVAVVTFMDNLQGKQIAHAHFMSTYLNYAEKIAVKQSDHLVSDSEKVSLYLQKKFGKSSTLIPYAVNVFERPDESVLANFDVSPYQYDVLIARMVPQNELEIILDGVVKANIGRPFLVIGNHHNVYAYSLREKYKSYPQIRFLGGIHDRISRDNLRYFSNLYFHANTTSSTNAFLLNAMACKALVAARNNALNASIMGKDGFYFDNANDVALLLSAIVKHDNDYNAYLSANIEKIMTTYNWNRSLALYDKVFKSLNDKEVSSAMIKENSSAN
ncbi:MAG: DUF1972 domain-containing protein [Pedobacter sp.]|nr:MAG: DUF1972 domain-containing protein [Pedobacter sp.]